MNNPKILVAVGHGLYEPWINILHEGQRKTWLRWPIPEGMKVIHFHGTPLSFLGWKLDRLHEKIRWTNRWVALPLAWFDRIIALPFKFYIPKIEKSTLLKVEEETFQTHFPDAYLTFQWKFISILKYFFDQTDFDYIFSTTTSSMIKPFALKRLVSKFNNTQPIYAGVKAYNGANFAAGNNRLLSRSAVDLVLKNRSKIDPGTIEDKALGELMHALQIPFIELPSLNITTTEQLNSPNIEEEMKRNFHIRVKSGTFENRNDVALMQAVFKRINDSGGEI
jgi:hypothetical protein